MSVNAIKSLAWALASALLAAGCTTQLNAVRVENATNLPAAGAPYSLPFTQFTVTLTRRLVSCVDADGNSDATIGFNAEFAQAEVPDPKRQYVIDLESLQGLSKKTNLVIEYHPNGALKSINADAKDQTAAIVTSATQAAGTLVRNIAGVAAGPGSQACNSQPMGPGLPSILELVTRDIPAQEKALLSATRDVAETTAELDRETALAATLGKDWAAADRKRMAALVSRLYARRKALELATASLKDNLDKVTVVSKKQWPQDGTTFTGAGLASAVFAPIDDEILDKWLSLQDGELKRVSAATSVDLRIATDLPASSTTACVTQCPGDARQGIKYRVPQRGRLEAYAAPDGEEKVVAKHESLISQLGPIYALPLKSIAFSERTLVATFTDAGLPERIGLQSNAPAEAAASSLAGFLTEASAVRADVTSTKLERVQAQTALLVAERQLEVARSALEPAANASAIEGAARFQADTALANAELAYLEAVRALEVARQQAAGTGGAGR